MCKALRNLRNNGIIDLVLIQTTGKVQRGKHGAHERA